MPTIYLATPKNSTPLIDEKLKYVVVKENGVSILNNKQYKTDSTHILTLETGKSNAKYLKKHIENQLNDLNLNYPAKFLELLKDNFDIQEQQLQDLENNLLLTTPKSTLDEEHKKLIEAISSSQSSTPILRRPNSVNYESVSENTLRKTPSFYDLPDKNSPKISRAAISPDVFSSQHSIPSQNSLENAEQAHLNYGEIRTFFTKKENTYLSNIKTHGLNIQNGYFSGGVKSKILLEITQLADQIKESSNEKNNEALIDQIDILKQKIDDNHGTLSRYRGFSSFKCFATLWGGGRVKSIEYVDQLRDQLNSLTEAIAPIRSTVQ